MTTKNAKKGNASASGTSLSRRIMVIFLVVIMVLSLLTPVVTTLMEPSHDHEHSDSAIIVENVQ